jgi:hypothetical protein
MAEIASSERERPNKCQGKSRLNNNRSQKKKEVNPIAQFAHSQPAPQQWGNAPNEVNTERVRSGKTQVFNPKPQRISTEEKRRFETTRSQIKLTLHAEITLSNFSPIFLILFKAITPR